MGDSTSTSEQSATMAISGRAATSETNVAEAVNEAAEELLHAAAAHGHLVSKAKCVQCHGQHQQLFTVM